MVSPLDKQSHDAGTGGQTGESILPVVVSPDGETAGWGSEGAFAEPENYSVSFFTANNKYLSRRSVSGWMTLSAFAPRGLVDEPFASGLDADLSPDMRTKQVSCGVNPPAKGERGGGSSVVCALARGRRQMANHVALPDGQRQPDERPGLPRRLLRSIPSLSSAGPGPEAGTGAGRRQGARRPRVRGSMKSRESAPRHRRCGW